MSARGVGGLRSIAVVGALLLGSASAVAARLAVLPVPADDPAAQALAAQVEGALQQPGATDKAGDDVVDDATVALKMRGPAGPAVDVAVARAGVVAADEAFAAIEHERSVSLLESVIAGLEQDRDFSVEKRAVLEEARLSCAQRLIGLAGPSETGKAETKNGEAARRHLQGVLKSNPGMVLPPGRYPPKMKSLFSLAEGDVGQMGSGGLDVQTTPPGATVWVDGRGLGTTPLRLPNALAPGRWRLWVEANGDRSIARVVDVSRDAVVVVEIDLGFEGSLVSGAAPGISPVVPFNASMLQRLASFLDVDRVLLVGVDAGRPWGLAAGGKGGLRAGTAPVGVDGVGLASWLRSGVGEGFAPGVPATVFAGADVAAAAPGAEAAEDVEGGVPWLLVGVGGAVGAVIVVGAVVGGVVYATRTVNPTIGISVGALP